MELDFIKLKKNVKKLDSIEGNATKLALLGDASTQFLKLGILGYGVEKNLKFDIYEAEYDAVDLEMMNPNSDLYAFNPEYIAIFLSSRKLHKSFHKLAMDKRVGFAEEVINKIRGYIQSAQAHSSAKLLISNYTELEDMVFCNFGNKVYSSWTYQLRKINFKLMDLAIESESVFINDLQSNQNHFGIEYSFDAKSYIRGDITSSFDILPLKFVI